MAATIRLGLAAGKTVLNHQQIQRSFNLSLQRNLNTINTPVSNKKKLLYLSLGALGIAGGALVHALNQPLYAEGMTLHPPKYPWDHHRNMGFNIQSFDHASIRRGYEVYKQVCSACHSLRFVHYRNLVGVCHTEAEAKAEAEQIEVQDGPNDEGELFMRPGKLADPFPKPYPNDEAAKFANNGALPPDLSFITLARHDGENYVFSLLTGYCDPPAGVQMNEGTHYNPYFPGGQLSMKEPLYTGIIEYSDGTPASKSQMAKDVVHFLHWCADPYMDWRKKKAIQLAIIAVPMMLLVIYYEFHVWSGIKTRKYMFKLPRK